MAANIDKKKAGTADIVKMIATLGIPMIVLQIPTNTMFTEQLRLFLAITLLAILAYAFENFNQTLVSLALPFAYTLCNVAPAEVVFSPWSSNIPWMVLGGLMLANMAEKTGLLKRIAYKCLIWTGGTYRGIIYGLGLAGFAATILLSGNGIIPMAALAYGLCLALNLGKSKASAGIMLASAFSCIMAGSFSFNPAYFMYAAFGNVTPNLSWVDFFLKQPVGIIYFLVVLVLVERLCRPKEEFNNKNYFVAQYDQLGKMSLPEIKSVLICGVLFLFIITGNIHKIPVIWGFGIIPLLAFLPGINVCDAEDMAKTNFGITFFTAACMSIGSVGATLGIGQLVSELALPILSGQSPTTLLFFLYVLCIVLNFLMTPIAIAAAFTLPFVEIATQMGLNPHAMLLFMIQALDQVFLPYEYVMYLVVFSFGMISIKDFVKIMTLKTICCTLYLFFLLLPFWHFIGFLYLR